MRRLVLLSMLVVLVSAGTLAVQPSDVLFWSDLSTGRGYTAFDHGSLGVDGAIVGFPAWSTQAPSGLGRSIALSGSQYIVFPEQAYTVGAANQSYSVSVWFRSNNSGPQMGFVGAYAPGIGYPLYLDSRGPTLLVSALWDTVVNPQFSGKGSFQNGKWHQAVQVRDGAAKRVTLYVDGTALGNYRDTTTRDMNSTTPIYFGYNPGTATFYTGNIAQPVLVKGVLTAADVKALYNAGAGKSYCSFFNISNCKSAEQTDFCI